MAELAVPHVADGRMQRAIGGDREPQPVMVVARRQAGEEVHGIAERAACRVVAQAHDLAVEMSIRARGVGHPRVGRPVAVDVRVGHIHVVLARSAQQLGM